MNDNKNFYERLELEGHWLKNAVSVTYWNDIDVALNVIRAKYTETIEDIKAEIKSNILDDPVNETNTNEMAQFNSALMLSLDIIEKHISGEKTI